ncbi:MAG: DsrE family protein [Syntrophobacteraceae bacterium]|nr:DsrE family protein [Syntrophobacteraceae bacterium]
MKWAFVISTNDAETMYNAMRLANVALKKGDEVSVFMLGKGVEFQEVGTDQFDVAGQIQAFNGNGGDFLV